MGKRLCRSLHLFWRGVFQCSSIYPENIKTTSLYATMDATLATGERGKLSQLSDAYKLWVYHAKDKSFLNIMFCYNEATWQLCTRDRTKSFLIQIAASFFFSFLFYLRWDLRPKSCCGCNLVVKWNIPQGKVSVAEYLFICFIVKNSGALLYRLQIFLLYPD